MVLVVYGSSGAEAQRPEDLKIPIEAFELEDMQKQKLPNLQIPILGEALTSSSGVHFFQ